MCSTEESLALHCLITQNNGDELEPATNWVRYQLDPRRIDRGEFGRNEFGRDELT
jgi:hypothetical protein